MEPDIRLMKIFLKIMAWSVKPAPLTMLKTAGLPVIPEINLSVVWLGRDDNKPIGLTGSTGALQVWTSLMKQISKQPVTLIPPENVVMAGIDPNNGLLANKTCKRSKEYPYLAGSEPTAYSVCGQEVIEQDKTWFDDLFSE